MSRLGSEFDNFLCAPIGEDKNGVLLRVVSVLGRLDLDPWQEAARLAGLPAEAAVQKFAALLGALPDPTLQRADAGALATRLIALLPCRPDPANRPAAQCVATGATTHPRALMNAILFAFYMLLFVLGTQFLFGPRDPTTHADTAHAPAPVAVPSQTSTTPPVEK